MLNTLELQKKNGVKKEKQKGENFPAVILVFIFLIDACLSLHALSHIVLFQQPTVFQEEGGRAHFCFVFVMFSGAVCKNKSDGMLIGKKGRLTKIFF